MRRFLLAVLFGLLALLAGPALAQDADFLEMEEDEQQSAFLRFVQDQLSTPERQIRISNISGVLSTTASIDEITIADTEGVYARIVDAAIDWNLGALFVGRLEIRSLSAELIEVLRTPVAEERLDLPPPEAGGFEIPDFPVAIVIEELSVPRVVFGESLFGLGSEISLTGDFVLDGGSLDANLDIVRLDGPGGTLSLDLAYAGETEVFDLDLILTEPENGILVNLLQIEGRPDIRLELAGSGPVADLVADLTFDAGGVRALAGRATLRQAAEGILASADLSGPIAALVAPPYRDFFGTETALAADILLREDGAVEVSGLRLSGGELTLEGSGATTPDGFLRRLEIDAVVASPAGGPVTLPVAGAATTVGSAQLSVDYGTGAAGDGWNAAFAATDFRTDGLAADALAISADGVAADLDDPAARRVTFNADGTLTGITASEEIEAALGDGIGFGVAGLWSAGEPVQLAEVRLAGDALQIAASGMVDDWVFRGGLAVITSSIAPFSGLAGRELSGALDLRANGTISPLIGGFDLNLDGTGTDLAVDDEIADALLDGTVRLTGRLARTEAGIAANRFSIANEQLSLTADGSFATGEADFRFDVTLADLGLISPEARGRLEAVGTARGAEGAIDLDFDARIAAGELVGRPLRDAAIGFSGRMVEGDIAGDVTGTAFLDGHRVTLATSIATTEDSVSLRGLDFTAAGTRVAGDLVRDAEGLITGRLSLASPDVSTAAALLLVEARGAVEATVDLSAADGEQAARIEARVRDLTYDDIRVQSADVRAGIADLFGVPAIDGTVDAQGVSVAGIDIATLSGTARSDGAATDFDLAASLANATDVTVAGSLAPEGEGYRVALDRAELVQGPLSARLAAPASLLVDGDTVVMDTLAIDVGGGRITATGTAGEDLDIAVTIAGLPLSIANTVQPGLGLAGTIDGTARITGSGTDPRAAFELTGSGLNAAALSEFGIGPISASASGTFAGGTVTLTAAQATGPQGLTVSASGTVPLEGGGLDLAVTGSAPLTLANPYVADRGGLLSGTASLDARITGSLADPQFSGRVATAGAEYFDPELNLRLQNVTGAASLSGQTVSIETLTATLATGGTVSATGTVSLQAPGFPVNVNLALNSARYADGNLFVATLSGNLALTGNLAQSPTLAGSVFVERAEISVPEIFGGAGGPIDVRHVAAPPRVVETLARAQVDARGAPIPQDRPSIIQLDVLIEAPNQVFIRGRGLDAEVGGSVRLTGPVTDVQPIGGLSLIRGRLEILGQRIVFESGTVTLVGDLDPFIDLTARAEGDGITVFVNVSGRVSEIEIGFSSNPPLPEDEVLARLIFNRSMGELSPLQIARLAGAAAELAGGGGTSLLDSLRGQTGLDDLDLVTDESGNLAVQAGAYIQDNVYLGVQAGAGGETRVTIDLDITENLTARGSAGSDGNSSIGIFYEQDY